ncbi:beta-ketoacyl synthase, partial [Frankia sp. AgB1.9]|uniref:acyl carrier protein n=1 Tax=unclassified Frankia TaxID=2632575 RepID=UPI001A404137
HTLTTTDHARLARSGVIPFSVEEGLALLDQALRVTGKPLLVPAALSTAGTAGDPPAILRALAPVFVPRARAARRARPVPLPDRLVGLTAEEQEAALLDVVRTEAAVVLGHPDASAVDAQTAFRSLGFDSLAAVELRNRLSDVAGLRLSSTITFDYPTAAALARHLWEELSPAAGDVGPVDEEGLRRVLASVPMERFRELGVLEALMSLSGSAGLTAADTSGRDGRAAAAESAAEVIAVMEVDDLVERALGLGSADRT